MALKLQAVVDAPSDQNFRQLGTLFPIQGKEIAGGAKELFLQLAAVADRKIAFGVAELTWAAAQTPTTKEVTHGLGTTPVIVLASVKFEGNSSSFVNAGKYTSTKFNLYGYNAPGAISITLEVAWVAIG